MDKALALERLRACQPQLEALGVRSLYLFGSTQRGTAQAGSDVDLFLDYVEGRFDLFDLVAVKNLLSSVLPAAVDVTTRGSLHPRLRDDIERGAVRVF